MNHSMKLLIGELPFAIVDPIGIVNALAERRTKRRVHRQQHAIAINQLREHLLAFGALEQLELFGQSATGTAAGVSAQSFCRDVANTWTDKQIMALCDGIIRASLEGLKTYVNSERRRELLNWFAPSSNPDETLSFAFCCRVAGLNPEPIYTHVWKSYRNEITSYLETESRADYDEHQRGFAFIGA